MRTYLIRGLFFQANDENRRPAGRGKPAKGTRGKKEIYEKWGATAKKRIICKGLYKRLEEKIAFLVGG